MRVVFRVDASLQIGTGHVMRCLSLADELKRKNNEVSFVCRDHDGDLISFVENKGYVVHVIPFKVFPPDVIPDYEAYDEYQVANLMVDASQTIEALENIKVDWLIVDHYAIDYQWESELKKYVKSILVIDDLADREHNCDVLLDQNWFGIETIGRYDHLLPNDCTRLLGPDFALLSKDYTTARKKKKVHKGQIKRILIFMGGVDSGKQTVEALTALCLEELKYVSVDVVIGNSNKDLSKIINIASNRKNTVVHKLLPNLVELMMNADLMLCTGGSTTWERCCLGLPAIVVIAAKNQSKFTKLLAKDGVHLLLDSSKKNDREDWFVKVRELACDSDKVKEMSTLSSNLVDGEGVGRVLSALHGFSMPIGIRKVTKDDEKLLFDWANDPYVRKFAFNGKSITKEGHHDWFRGKFNDPDCLILVGLDFKKIPIGQVRIDSADEVGMIDISVDSAARGLGYATILLKESVKFWKSTKSKKPLVGDVLIANKASCKVFVNAGFREQDNDDAYISGVIRYILD